MRAFTSSEMMQLYRFTKSLMLTGGAILLGYGTWWLASPLILHVTTDTLWLFGIFPIYVGAMLILIAIAMKEDWFTNARRYW